MPVTIPPYLKSGDAIAITCPAGYMAAGKAAACINILQEQGYEVVIGETLGSSSVNYFSGTDEQRLNEMQGFLDDKNIKAILCARGGYGTGRIIDKLCFKKFSKRPKWIIGYSDITVLHTFLYQNYNVASLHAPMAAAFNETGHEAFTGTLLAALRGDKGNYRAKPSSFNRYGKAKGTLIGGNLSLLANSIGTSSDFETKNCILFIEDIGEQLYSIDRMLSQLKRTGMLKSISGLVVGGFTDMKDCDRPFGKNIYEIISETVAEYDYPVCYDFPVSHGNENVALKQGVKYNFSVNEEGGFLAER